MCIYIREKAHIEAYTTMSLDQSNKKKNDKAFTKTYIKRIMKP